jgi:hypothetical protein
VKATRTLWSDTRGQDLIEYVLVMAVVTIACAVLFCGEWRQLLGHPAPDQQRADGEQLTL